MVKQDKSNDLKRSSESSTPPSPMGKDLSGSKRQKITLSCNECRRRKIKCDHAKPVCENCIKRGSEDACTYARSPWIDIIAAESKVYQEIDVLKKENDVLMDAVASIKSELILVYKKNHNNISSSDDDILSTGNGNLMYDAEFSNQEVSGSFYSSAMRPHGEVLRATQDDGSPSEASDINKKMSKYEYHFLKDTTEIPLRNRVKKILSTDVSLIELQSYHDVEVPRVLTTLRCGNDSFYKNYYLNQLITVLPSIEVIEEHIKYYFNSNYHRHMPVLSESMLLASFRRMFLQEPGRIKLDQKKELEDFVELGIILIVLKIASLYRETVLNDQQNVLLSNAYVAYELGEVKIRASIITLQALLILTSFRLFSHKVSDLELFFSTELCRDMAIALGIHKNTDIIYEHKSKEEKHVLQAIKVMLNRGW